MFRSYRWSLLFVAVVLGTSGCQPGEPTASPAPPAENEVPDAQEAASENNASNASDADAPDPSTSSSVKSTPAAGKEEIVTLTPRAAEAIRARIAAEPRKDKLRVSIVKEFAGPVRWSASMVAAPDPFDDEVFTSQGITIVVDRGTRQHIAGTTIDFVPDGPRKGFRFENPRLEEER